MTNVYYRVNAVIDGRKGDWTIHSESRAIALQDARRLVKDLIKEGWKILFDGFISKKRIDEELACEEQIYDRRYSSANQGYDI